MLTDRSIYIYEEGFSSTKEHPDAVARPTPYMSVMFTYDAIPRAYHNLHKQHISRLSSLDLEWSRQVINLGKVHIFHVIGAVIV